jgi:hypothetical protein
MAANSGQSTGLMLPQNGGAGNFRHGGDGFWGQGFPRGFNRNRPDFGTNIVVAPTVVAPAARLIYYYAPVPPYESLRCFLHREVQTPNGPALEPVFVC